MLAVFDALAAGMLEVLAGSVAQRPEQGAAAAASRFSAAALCLFQYGRARPSRAASKVHLKADTFTQK